jgi:hypothetical protein
LGTEKKYKTTISVPQGNYEHMTLAFIAIVFGLVLLVWSADRLDKLFVGAGTTWMVPKPTGVV